MIIGCLPVAWTKRLHGILNSCCDRIDWRLQIVWERFTMSSMQDPEHFQIKFWAIDSKRNFLLAYQVPSSPYPISERFHSQNVAGFKGTRATNAFQCEMCWLPAAPNVAKEIIQQCEKMDRRRVMKKIDDFTDYYEKVVPFGVAP